MTKLRISFRVRFGLWVEHLGLRLQGSAPFTWPRVIDAKDGYILISEYGLSDAEIEWIKSRWLKLLSGEDAVMVISGKFRVVPVNRRGG